MTVRNGRYTWYIYPAQIDKEMEYVNKVVKQHEAWIRRLKDLTLLQEENMENGTDKAFEDRIVEHFLFFKTMYGFSGLWDIFWMNILETYTRKSLVNKKHNRGI